MQQIADWLKKLGMSEYAQRFAENRVDFSVLPDLTDHDLEKLGVVLGDRRKMLRAIASLEATEKSAPAIAAAATASAVPVGLHDTAERRQVTVMFSDLVGSTALSARLDPEDLREIISAYQKCVAETVGRFGGFVAKFMGDGVLIYFGYPHAHEDDAERAVRAGLELVASVSGLKTHAALQTRVGIATGLVVVGDLIGSGASQEQAIVGETPNLAARLQGAAEPNSVVIAEGTRKLLGNLFELEDLGASDLKGIAGPVRAWAALRPSSAESRFEALHASGLAELVGREEELELLLRRWSKAKTGQGQVVLLSGEAGIGKSRLTAALPERLAAEPHTRLRYFCSPQHTDSALYPIISQMERAARFARDDAPQAKLDKLDTLLAQSFTPTQDAALLVEMLSLPNDGRLPTLELAPQQRRQKTLEALTAQLEALSRSNPVLMIFEDVHWIDPTSLEALGRTVDRIRSLGVLLIVTYRPEFEPPWIGRPHVTALTINRLGQDEIAALIDGVTGNKPLPTNIRQDIIERADGIPLFVEEMTKAVLEAGGEQAAERAVIATPSPSNSVPASLHASLMARLDRLGSAKEVAQIGAVIGREFSHDLMVAVVSAPEPELLSALDRLVAAGLLFRQGVPPDTAYLFKHSLLRDAAYSTLLRGRRQQLHSRIAATLENQFAEIVVAQPQLMAQHCADAGLPEKAIAYWLKAGQQAIGRSAMLEAVSQLRKGLELLAELPDTAVRHQQELELQVALGPALMATKGFSAPEVGDTIARARALAEQVDRSDYLIALLYGQSAYHLFRSEHHLALSVAQQIERLGEARNDRASLLLGHYVRAIICTNMGEFVAAGDLSLQCDGLADPGNRAIYASLSPEDPYAMMLVTRAVILANLGYLDQAQASANKALAEARRLQQAYTLVAILGMACWSLWPSGSSDQANQQAEEMIAVSNDQGFALWAAWGMVHRGWSLGSLGREEEGLSSLKEGLALVRATGEVTGVPWVLIMAAEAHTKLGQMAEGLNCLTEAQRVIEACDERGAEAELHRVRGDLLKRRGDQAAAEESYQRALVVAQRQNAKTLELRAATSLARLWRDGGKRREAFSLLTALYAWFSEGLGTPLLQQAKVLLDQLRSNEYGAPLA